MMTDPATEAMQGCVDNGRLKAMVQNWPTYVLHRTDAQVAARTGQLQCLTSDAVGVALAVKTNVLTIANPAGSGKVLYVASISVQALGIAATVYRYRGATVTGGIGKVADASAVTPATVKTGGLASSGTLESVTIANQADPSPSGTVRIPPGESLTWAFTPTVAGSAVVSVQLWAESAS